MFRGALLASLILAMGGFVANSQTIVVVPGNAQLGLAGQSAGAKYNGDTAPLNSPALASVALLPGQALRITASGLVSGFAPDGIDASDSACGNFGIGRIFAKRGSLIGVFLAATMDSNANLPNVDYLVGGREVDVLTPILQQPFLIGSGQTPSGSVRTIVIPEQAARLYLGVASFSTASLTGSFTAIISSAPAPGTLGNPVKVFGISQVALAGEPAGTTFHGDTAPLNSPVQVGIPLVGGQRIQITAGGNADGNIGANETTGGDFGIGQISAPRGSLIGVFLGNSVDSNMSPPFADYTAGAPNIAQVTPLLQQPFFIGSGTTSGGASRTIVVPAGATRLFLGTTGTSVAERSGSVLATATRIDTDLGQVTETLIVLGRAQLVLAGQPDGRMYNGDSAPLNSPALSKLTLVPGQALQVAASGVAGGNAPDGATTLDSTGGALGIGQIVAGQNSLIGVFLGATVDPDAVPPKVDFSAGAREVGVLSPMLQQPFLVGAGTTPDGSNRTIIIPAGATRLYLGVNNFSTRSLPGSFTANISMTAAPPATPGNPVRVYGISQLALAGQPPGTLYQDDSSPLNSPVQVGVPLAGGQSIHITAPASADGSATENVTTGGKFGIGQIYAPRGSLIGVFLSNLVDSGLTPPFIDYSGARLKDTQLKPLLQQPFFAGSGTVSGAGARSILVPTGATRLFLGTMGGSVAKSSGSVIATVDAGTPTVLTAVPTALAFQEVENSTAADSKTVQIGGTAGASFELVSSPPAWLVVAFQGITVPGQMVVKPNLNGLPAGQYTFTLGLRVVGQTVASVQIPVSLTVIVQSQVRTLGVLNYQLVPSGGGSLSAEQVILVGNDNSNPSIVQVVPSAAWMKVSPGQLNFSAGTGPQPVKVQIDRSVLPSGSYISGSIGLQGLSTPQQVGVNVALQAQRGLPLLSRSAMTFNIQQSQLRAPGDNVSQTVTIINDGPSPVGWKTVMTDAFVSIDPASSITPLQHGDKVDVKITVTDRSLTVLPNNLPWEEILSFQFDDGSLFEVKVDVFVSATVVPSELFPDKTGLIFTGSEHQTIVIQNQTSVDYSVSATAKQGWIKVSPASAVAKARNQPPLASLDVSVDTATAPSSSGLAQGSIEINFKDGSKSVATQNVEVLFLGEQTVSSSERKGVSDSSVTAGACIPGSLRAVFSSLSEGVTVTAGQPTQVDATIVDNCGKPVTAGAATVSFSNGDPAVKLLPDANGSWQGSWTPSFGSSVVLTLGAVADQETMSGTATRSVQVDSSGIRLPSVPKGEVRNAASLTPSVDRVAPGSILTILGSQLADGILAAGSSLPLSLGSTAVRLGTIHLPLFYVSPTQVNAFVPPNLMLDPTAPLVVENAGLQSAAVSVVSVATDPGIFGGAVVSVSGRVNSPAAPAQRGDTVSIYCTGLGPVTEALDPTLPAPVDRLLYTKLPVAVFVQGTGGQWLSSYVSFAGLAPGNLGVYQVNVQIPSNAATGDQTGVYLIAGTRQSNQVSISVR